MQRDFDCSIVGGGPAGAVAARALARAGLRVAICDSGRRPVRRIGESLPGATRALLADLDLDHILEDGHSKAFGNLSAWGANEIVATDFLLSPHGHGWHLDRAKFDRDLLNAAVASGAVLMGELASAKWLIDCSGRKCFSAQHLGVERVEDDDLTAVYGWFPALDCDQRTLIESAEEGWWYTSLISASERVTAFHTSRARAEQIFRNPQEWDAVLGRTHHIRKLISNLSVNQSLHLAAANGAMLKEVAKDNWLAAGDAAMSFDPLSAQGLFNAIYTGRAAAQAILESRNGDTEALQNYSSRLKSIRSKYLQHQFYFYGQERRWSGHEFWKMRSQSEPIQSQAK